MLVFDPRKVIKAAEDAGQNAIYEVKTAIEDRRNKKYWKQYYKDSSVLMPVFEKDIREKTFEIPKMVIISEPDEKHRNNDACRGSIGNREIIDGLQILRVYPSFQSSFPIHFTKCDDYIFYVDAFQPNYYVGITNYFNTIRKARVRELEKLAYSLGAKSITIEIKHKISKYSSLDANVENHKRLIIKTTEDKKKPNSVDVKKNGEIALVKTKSEIDEQKILVSNTWEGNNNPKPIDLIYFKYDDTINDLISMRLSGENVVINKSYTISYSDSLGIKDRDAAKIDTALNTLNFGLSGKFIREYKTEQLNYFSYMIGF